MRGMANIVKQLAIILALFGMLVAGAYPSVAGGPNEHPGQVVAAEHLHAHGHGPLSGGHGSAAHDHASDTLTFAASIVTAVPATVVRWALASDQAIRAAGKQVPDQPPKLTA